ncbi:CGNR zinc finger domain-containing protein [Chloroflexota bacterium]
MISAGTTAGTLKLLGGRLSLDYANTADWHAGDQPVEYLKSYGDLVAWSRHAGALSERLGERLLEEAGRRPADASAVLERAIVLREAIYRIFSALSQERPPQAADLETFNSELAGALGQTRLVFTPEGLAWDWAGKRAALDQMLWYVVRDAASLLTSEAAGRVGQCTDDRCGWLFLDMSRNRSRRWCSMEDCGNRAKARRHYLRSRLP